DAASAAQRMLQSAASLEKSLATLREAAKLTGLCCEHWCDPGIPSLRRHSALIRRGLPRQGRTGRSW
ncbi:MAG: hypothetical protein ACK6D4_19945, partial [Planctomyces sp.]